MNPKLYRKYKHWNDDYKDKSKDYVKILFAKYKACTTTLKLIKVKGVPQKVTVDYDKIVVQGSTFGKPFEDRIIDKASLEKYCENYISKVDEITNKLPGMFKKIIIRRFIKRERHKLIFCNLELPRSTYFFMMDEAIMMLTDLIIANNIEIEDTDNLI